MGFKGGLGIGTDFERGLGAGMGRRLSRRESDQVWCS